MNDYLWDRRGPIDDEVAQLERTLGVLRYRQPLAPAPPIHWSRHCLAVAATVLVGVFAWQLDRGVPQQASQWRADGTALFAGQRFHTGSRSVVLNADNFGEVRVEPESELRIGPRHGMSLRQGKLHALIWAPPGQFVVETPSARAVDLGCQYELSVDADGNGFLSVETGWVAFQHGALESFIPAGAACRTSRRSGPGIPFYLDAGPKFRDAVNRGDLRVILAEARTEDALSLWHLLTRVGTEDRRKVFERFRQLAPVRVPEDRVVALDRNALDECWNALGLDSADWWREWKRDWRQ